MGMSQALGQLGNFQFSPELARPPHALAARTPIGEPPFFFFSHPGAQLQHKFSDGMLQ